MTLAEIGEIVQNRRQLLALRQEDLSEMSGVNLRTIQHLESGKGNPSFATMQKLGSILGLEITVQVKQSENA